MRVMRVLIVDDDEEGRELLSVFYGAEGHLVETAPDGSEALARMTAFQPDLVVTDLEMPGMTGLELIRAVRVAWPSCAVLLVTARHDHRTTLEKIALLGGFECLFKPLDLEALSAATTRATTDRPTADLAAP
jgi:DNA-binding response OmpR family regulator